MAQNQFKTEGKEKNKKPKKKRLKLFNPITKAVKAVVNVFTGDKVVKSTGIFLLLFSVFLLLAFSSFLFTWKVDQDKFTDSWYNILFNPDIQVENWLGKLGGIASHQLVYNGFGIMSFLLVFLLFVVGFRVLFKISLFSIRKSFRYGVFAILWLSVFFGFFAHKFPLLGGAFGYYVNYWLSSVVGSLGVGLILVLTLALFLVYTFNFSFDFFSSKQEEDEMPESEVVSGHTTALDIENTPTDSAEMLTPVHDEPTPEEPPKNDFTQPEEVLEAAEPAIELNTAIPDTPVPSTDGDVDFSVEEALPKDEILSDDEVDSKVEDFGEYDPTLDLSSFQFPSIELLKDFGDAQNTVTKEELEANKNRILGTLENYNIKITSIKATIGPTVTLYEIVPAPGVRISKIKNLEDDIALSLSALGIRIIAPIPGKGTIGIEVPNQNPEIVSMRTVVASDKFQNAKMELPVVMGKTITNETFVFDLAKMPHLLMAGATGQGKSVGLNAVLTSLLYKKHPSQLKLVLVDPKKVELTLYNKIERHYLAKLPDTEDAIITDNQKVIHTLNSLCIEMDERYELLKTAMVRNIVEYNSKFVARKLNPENGHKFLPYIVLVIDEFADLIMTAGKEVETPIARLAQLARAIGIHLIIATQRPSANIITGIIKANFPGRIAFRVTSGIDSRTILDASGADQLIGRGDMLISQGNDLTRVQCAFVDTPEVEAICEFIGDQRGYPEVFTLPEYVGESATGGSGTFDGEDRDALFDDAARVLVQHQQGSASLLQRKMKIGYNRAGRLIDQMEEAGIIGPFEGSKARQVLISDLETLEQFLKDLAG